MSLPEDFETELEQINNSTPTEETANEQQVESKPANELIPRHRYNFQRDQRMAAEQRAAQLEQELQKYQQYLASIQQQQAQQPQGPTIEEQLAEFDLKIEDARADGDKDQVAKLRAEQRRLEQQVVAYQVKQTLPQQAPIDQNQVMKHTSDGMRLEKLIDRLEVEYPMLDEDHPNFDPDLSEEVMTLYDSLVKKMPMATAMERAVAYVTKAHEINPLQGLLSARKTNVKRNIEAARAQPPELSGFGYDSSRAGVSRPTDVMKMTQEQFEALGDKEIEKLLDLA